MIPRRAFEQTLLQLLAPLRPLLDDDTITEIMVNGPNQVYVERAGKLSLTEIRFAGPESLQAALRSAAQFVGRRFDEKSPVLEGRLPDGSRLQAVTAPVAPDGPFVSIRRFRPDALDLDRLVANGSVSQAAARLLVRSIAAKRNLLIGGGAGSGKTSLLRALVKAVPASERIVVIEDCRELELSGRHVVALEAHPPTGECGHAVTVGDLFRAALRLRPDRIIVGEIRGAEALDLVQAMTSGHGGCLATLHATLPIDSLHRLETMCLMSGTRLPLSALRSQIGSGVDLLVQVIRRRDGSRAVTSVTRVEGYDPNRQRYELRDLLVARASPARSGPSPRRGSTEGRAPALLTGRSGRATAPTDSAPAQADRPRPDV